MSRSGGMSQLVKGMMIGIVLILAIVGTMSLLDKSNSPDITAQVNPAQQKPIIESPSISINPSSTKNPTDSDTTASIKTNDDQAQVDQTNSGNMTDTQPDTMTPVLEDEEKVEEVEKKPEPIQYGLIKVSAINPENQEKLKANFSVFDKDDVKVAESNNTDNTSYRLPVGQYKVTTTLTQPDEKTGRTLPVVQKSQYISVRAEVISKQVFELEPPPTIGILQVSATSNNKTIRANFIVQKENGETIATRNNVTNSLFKLKAGSYKVSVKSGNNSDFKTIVVEPGESTEEVFELQEAFNQGRVLVRIFDTRSSKPVRADIAISSANGKSIQELKSVSKTELSLAAGNYKIRVTGPNGQSNRNITVTAGQALNEIFRFDAPQETSSSEGTQINDNVTIKAVENNKPDATPTEEYIDQDNNSNASVKILARNAADQKPLKSNIYIQTPTGKHLDKKIYVESAEFNLAPGVYKITVRSKNRENNVKTIRISANQKISETFLLNRPGASTTTPTLAPPKPTKNPSTIPNGFLSVAMLPARNQPVTNNGLNTHFIVTSSAGKKVVELTSVSSGNFKLDTGTYVVTAIHKNKRRNQRVTVRDGRTTRINFNSADFQTIAVRKGVLRSRVVNELGQPLRANLTVTNMRGQVVAKANGVSVGVFDLPPVPHNINVSYQGLSGSEVVKIVPGETTVQTFTIAPNRAASPSSQVPNNKPQDAKDVLRDKIKEELRRIF